MPLGTEEIPLQAKPHFGMLFFVLLIWHLLLYSVLWYPLVPVLIEDANQVPARQEYIWQCICSLKVLTLLFPLPLILGNRKRRGRKLYSKLFMNQEAAVGCRWFWFWTYFWRKVKGNVYCTLRVQEPCLFTNGWFPLGRQQQVVVLICIIFSER